MIDYPCRDDPRLPLSGAVNFRDLGGYRTSDGRRIRCGRIFRSDHLSRLTDSDRQLLRSLDLKVVCDLRTVREQQKAPDQLQAGDGLRLLSLPVEADGFDPAVAMDRLQAGDDSWLSMDFFIDLYRRYLDDFGPVWGKIITLTATADNLPLVFHCTGGKDRTGICAALLLKALGVLESDILADHELSNGYNRQRLRSIYAQFAALGIGPEKAAPYLQAPASPLVALLAHLNNTYGGIENYLAAKAGITRKILADVRAELLR